MPNHAHLLTSFPGEKAMLKPCESWKLFTATQINRQLHDKVRFWQSDAFDHLLRSSLRLGNDLVALTSSGSLLRFGLPTLRFSTRIDGREPRPLFAGNNSAHLLDDPEKRSDPAWPELPITQFVEEDTGLLVLSYSDIFRVDKTIKSWRNVGSIDIKYRWGRPDAVGAYPSVCAIHPRSGARESYVLGSTFPSLPNPRPRWSGTASAVSGWVAERTGRPASRNRDSG
jgi:hypothetical protein